MELLNVGFLTSTYDRDRQTGGNGASAVRDKRGQAIDARIIIDIGVAIAENVHELNVFDHLDLGAVSHTEAQHSFERIDIGISTACVRKRTSMNTSNECTTLMPS